MIRHLNLHRRWDTPKSIPIYDQEFGMIGRDFPDGSSFRMTRTDDGFWTFWATSRGSTTSRKGLKTKAAAARVAVGLIKNKAP